MVAESWWCRSSSKCKAFAQKINFIGSFPKKYGPFFSSWIVCFLATTSSTIWISRRAIIKTVSWKLSKVQFSFVRLNKRSNSNTEWNKMKERSSDFRNIVQPSRANIHLSFDLAVESIVDSDEYVKTNKFHFELKQR